MIEILKVVVVPGFVAYPYLDDPFDDIDNQDKYLLHNILEPFSYFFSAPLLYSGFNHCIRHLMLFQNDHLYNEYKSHFISELSAITDSSCIEKKGISGAEYASLFYFTVLHKSSFVHSYKDQLLCFLCRIIRILYYINRSIVCLMSSIGNYKQQLQSVVCHMKRLDSSVRFFENYLKCCIEHCIKKLESCTGRSDSLVRCLVRYILRLTKILLGLFGLCTEMTVQVERWMELLGSVVLRQSRLCLIESELGKQIKEIQSCVSRIRRVWWSLCKGSPKDILDELTSIIKSITETLESAKDLPSEIICIAKSDRETMECLRSSLGRICQSIQKIVLSLKFSVGFFTLSIKYIVCGLKAVGRSISWIIPDFNPYLCGIERNLECIRSARTSTISSIGSYDTVILGTKASAENLQLGIDSYRSKLESFIEVKPFLKCSIKSIKENVSQLQLRFMRENKNGPSLSRATKSDEPNNFTSKKVGYIYDFVILTSSHMNLLENRLVILNMYRYSSGINDVLMVLYRIESCNCVHSNYLGYSRQERQPLLLSFSPSILDSYILPKFHSINLQNKDPNYVCMCLVLEFHLYRNIMRCLCYLFDIGLELLSTISRDFRKLTMGDVFKIDISKLIIITIDVYTKLTFWIKKRYPILQCFCKSPNDPYYQFYISLILFICHLIENIFDRQNETTGDSIQSLSALKAELEHFKFDKTPGGSSSCDVYSTSVCIQICTYKVNSRLFYPEGKCNFVFEPMKWNGVCEKICCCCLKTGCRKPEGAGCCCSLCFLGQGQVVNCGCTQVNSASSCGDCFCKNGIWATIEFIINYGVSKGEDKYLGDYSSIPNFWCLYKMNECIKANGSSCTKKQGTGECAKEKIYCQFKTLLYKYYDLFTNEIFNVNIYGLLNQLKVEEKRKRFVTNVYVNRNQKLITSTRNIMMYETKYIASRETIGPGNNNYSYNNAYRINTRRAHGSLKYIIIKIVLILIIVVMTIFIRVKIETDDDYKTTNKSG